MARCKYGLSPISGTNEHWWDDKKAECTKCKQVLPHSKFHKNNTSYSRRPVGTTCMECTKDITFGYRRRDIKFNKYKNYKSIMRSEGNDCDMTYEEFQERWPKDNKCPMLGHELRRYPKEERGMWNGGRHYPYTPSVDHIDPRLPMSKNNLDIICWRANELKGDAIPEETELLFRHLELRDDIYWKGSLMDIISVSAVEAIKIKLGKIEWVGKYANME